MVDLTQLVAPTEAILTRAEEPAWLRELRAGARDAFLEQGIPTSHDEDWKYTNIVPAVSEPLVAPNGCDSAQLKRRLREVQLEGCAHAVFIDGRYAADLSDLSPTDGVDVLPLSQAIREESTLVAEHLSQRADLKHHAFCALNAATFSDGVCVRLRRNADASRPLQTVFLRSDQGEHPTAAHTRSMVIAQPGSRATVIEVHASVATARGLTTSVTDLFVDENAEIEHHRVNVEGAGITHVGMTHAHQSANSATQLGTFCLGAGFIRNDTLVTLAEPGARCRLDGLYLASDAHHVDNHTLIEHRAPHCESVEIYKGVLDANATGVFNGKVFVHREAQRTDARQNNANLLLSDTAKINTKPQLEIFADDVKCTHGATVGHLDEDAMFYLRTRGIGEKAARRLMVMAFSSDVINSVSFTALQCWLATTASSHLGMPDITGLCA